MSFQGEVVPIIKLSPLLRIVCIITIFLLILSAVIGAGMSFYGWWYGDAYNNIISGYASYYPYLNDYNIPRGGVVYLGTFLLDTISTFPYYAAMLSSVVLFFNIYRGKLWWTGNISLLRLISGLLIAKGLSPLLIAPLQVFLFTFYKKTIFMLYFGLTAESARLLIVGFSLMVLCWILDEASHLVENR